MEYKKFEAKHYLNSRFHHSYNETPDPKLFERHCHNGYELIYVIKGKGKYIVESAEYPLLPNTILLLRPYEYHYVCPQSDSPYERYVMHFSSEMFIDATETLDLIQPQKTGSLGVYFPETAVDQSIRTQLKMLNDTLSTHDEQAMETPSRSETVFRAMLNQILIFLSYLHTDPPSKAENELVASVIRYMGEHLAEDISLEDMARRFFVSKYHLCHAFHAHTGTSVFSYLTTKRIALAQQYLEDGSPAIRVAEQVGFRDYSVFYRAYRKITGKPPSHTKGEAKRGKRQG